MIGNVRKTHTKEINMKDERLLTHVYLLREPQVHNAHSYAETRAPSIEIRKNRAFNTQNFRYFTVKLQEIFKELS